MYLVGGDQLILLCLKLIADSFVVKYRYCLKLYKFSNISLDRENERKTQTWAALLLHKHGFIFGKQ
jgi:hypothetical protein